MTDNAFSTCVERILSCFPCNYDVTFCKYVFGITLKNVNILYSYFLWNEFHSLSNLEIWGQLLHVISAIVR